MKKMLKNLATVFMAGLLFALAACKTEVVEEVAAEQDKIPPSKVTELSVSAANGKAVLTWTNPTESDFFGTEITISPETEGVTSSFCIEGQPGQKSSAFINGLENGREYTFNLTALDKNQNKADYETTQGTPAAPASDTTPPADVTGLTVNAANGNAVLSWQNPEDADFAGVKISLEPAAGTLKYPVILENSVETFTVSGLENDVPYTFKIQSFDKNLNFAEGATEGATLEATPVEAGDTTPPADVTNLNATAANGKAVLTWTNPADSDFAGLRLTMTPAEGNLSYPVILSKYAESFAVYELENDKEYSFKVEAFDETLNYSKAVSYSAKSTATPVESSDTTAPADVTSLRVTATNSQAILAWENPEDEDFAGVKITINPAVDKLSSIVILGKSNIFTLSGLSNDTKYTFKVQAFDESLNFATGEGDGATATATPEESSDKTPPSDVTNLKISASNGNAILTWTNPTDSDFAGVKITLTPATGTLIYPVMLDKDVTTFTVSGLTNKQYMFKVESFDKNMNYSSGTRTTKTLTDTSDKTAPGNVTNLSVACENGTNGKVNAVLSWTDPGDTDLFGMEVTYAENTDSRSAIATMTKGSIFVAPEDGGTVINNLTAGKTYTFTVKTMDTNGNKSSGASKTETMSLRQLSELKITLTASTTEITNQDVTVSVAATTSSTVSKIFYVSAIKTNIDAVLKGTDITSAAKFTATENGTYTVAVVDYDGRRELSYITIENIDKTAPNELENFSASDDYTKKILTLTWDTKDTDVDYYLVTCTKDGNSLVTEEKSKVTTYELSCTDAGKKDVLYKFTVKAIDKVGNIGKETIFNFTQKAVPLVNKIKLSKEEFIWNDAGSEITASISGENFNLISEQTDQTLKVQILDKDDKLVSETEAVIDADNNAASATVIVPTLPDDASLDGENYTVKAVLCGILDEEHSTTFYLPASYTVSEVEVEKYNFLTSDETVKVTAHGTHFERAEKIELVFYSVDKNETLSDTSCTIDTSNLKESAETFETDLTLPKKTGTYKISLIIDDKEQVTSSNVYVYMAPFFGDFKIPKAGTLKKGSTVTGVIDAAYLNSPCVNKNDFAVTCSENSITDNAKFTVKSSGYRLEVTLTIPEKAGEYKVTFTYGDTVITATFAVKDFSYSIGDIVKNGSTNIGVVAVINENGVPLVLGKSRSSSKKEWAPLSTTGYTTNFEEIQSWAVSDGTNLSFTLDTDGSDNWDEITYCDYNGSQSAATNYPAFYYANNYGKSYSGEWASGWYIPTYAEIYAINQNKETVQTALNKISGFTFATGYQEFYWTSTQVGSANKNVFRFNFKDGKVENCPKNEQSYVIVLHSL